MKRFDSLFKVGAFVENYRNFGTMFAENLTEFEDSRYHRMSCLNESVGFFSCQERLSIRFSKNTKPFKILNMLTLARLKAFRV